MKIGSHLRLYTFSPEDYADATGVWSGPADWENGEELQVIQGMPIRRRSARRGRIRSQFSPDYAPEKIYAIAAKLMKNGGISPEDVSDDGQESYQRAGHRSPGKRKRK